MPLALAMAHGPKGIHHSGGDAIHVDGFARHLRIGSDGGRVLRGGCLAETRGADAWCEWLCFMYDTVDMMYTY